MMGYGAYGQWGGLVWMLIVGLIVVVPFWRLLPQFGLPAWLGLLAIFPLFALILLWIMAFRDRMTGGSA